MIIIATIRDDLHAQLVQAHVKAEGSTRCHIWELDRIAQRDALSFGIGHEVPDRVVDADGEPISVGAADVLWLRRVPSAQQLTDELGDDYARELTANECRGAALGLMRTHFRGTWVSSFEATQRASDKILQLQVARDAGFRIPRTLVTQSVEAARMFRADVGPLVVKTVVGVAGPMLQTVRIDDPEDFSSDAYMSAPSMFQEFVSGQQHLRLMAFGDQVHGGLITTSDTDWRGNLHVPIDQVDVPGDLARRIHRVLDALQLRMGIIDIKLDDLGEPVWLEVNPQGQFAFLDGLVGTSILEAFSAFLTCEADLSRRASG